MKILFATGVWGDAYIDKFLNVSLPSQLAEGNLQGAPWLERSRFLVMTSSAGAERLRGERTWRYLSTVIQTEIRVLEEIDGEARGRGKYQLMNLCQMSAIGSAREFDAIMFGYADTIWSAGTLQNAAARIEEGFDGVLAPGLPVRENDFLAALRDSSLWKERDHVAALTLSPRTLVRLTLEMLHPMAEANFWHQRVFGSVSSYTLWNVPAQGVALRAFHLHPVMIRTQPRNAQFFRRFSTSLDEEYVSNLFASKDRIYFARDSDEMALCSLMQPFPQSFQVDPPHPPSARALAVWAEANASILHREFYEEEYRLHYEDVAERDWATVSRRAARLARRVRDRLAIPDSLLSVEDPVAADARQSRVARLRYWQKPEYMEPWWMVELSDRELARVIRKRLKLALLRRINRAARRLSVDLRQLALRVRLSASLARWIPQNLRRRLVPWMTLPAQPERPDHIMSRCSGYPVRFLIRKYAGRLLARVRR